MLCACPCVCRRKRVPNVAYGSGTHVCIGEYLSLVELECAFKGLFTRLPNLHVSSAATLCKVGVCCAASHIGPGGLCFLTLGLISCSNLAREEAGAVGNSCSNSLPVVGVRWPVTWASAAQQQCKHRLVRGRRVRKCRNSAVDEGRNSSSPLSG